ncbi:MAG: hypothetical protein K9K67_15880 [Bacteriovoracaceae bacterium]|nr:hypothetical protein [Bacteriovoracaceae bacterium]
MVQEWRKCGVCKKSILFNQVYQQCSISSCRKSIFCSVDCWSVHDSVLGHKSAYAEEERAPENENSDRAKRRIIVGSSPKEGAQNLPMDTLIVISKLKSYVKAKSDMNTSGDVPDELSKFVRVIVNEAIEHARGEGRKTLMARDFQNIKL